MKRLLLLAMLMGVHAACGVEEPETSRRASFLLTSGESGEAVVAEVNDRPIHLSFVLNQVEKSAGKDGQQVLDELITLDALSQEAVERGYADHPEVVEVQRRAAVQAMLIDLVEEQVPLSSVTQDEITAYYREHFDNYYLPELVRITLVSCRKKRGGSDQAAREACESVRAEAIAGNISGKKGLRALKEAHQSEGISIVVRANILFPRRQTGRARWKGPASMPAPIADAAFSMSEPGTFSDLVAVGGGYHVLVYHGRTPENTISLDEVRGRISQHLVQEKRQRVFDALMREIGSHSEVETHPDIMENALEW